MYNGVFAFNDSCRNVKNQLCIMVLLPLKATMYNGAFAFNDSCMNVKIKYA